MLVKDMSMLSNLQNEKENETFDSGNSRCYGLFDCRCTISFASCVETE